MDRELERFKTEIDLRHLMAAAFETQIHERDAYKAVFSFGGTLSTLDHREVGNIPAAAENARMFAGELISMLRGLEQPAAAQVA